MLNEVLCRGTFGLLFSAIFIIWEENQPLNANVLLRLIANWYCSTAMSDSEFEIFHLQIITNLQ